MKKSELRQMIKEELLKESGMRLNIGDSYDTLLVKIPAHSHFKLMQNVMGKQQQISILPEDVDYFIAALKRIR